MQHKKNEKIVDVSITETASFIDRLTKRALHQTVTDLSKKQARKQIESVPSSQSVSQSVSQPVPPSVR